MITAKITEHFLSLLVPVHAENMFGDSFNNAVRARVSAL